MGRKGGRERGNSERDSAALGPSWGLPHPDHSAEGCLPLCTQICHLLYPRSQTPRDQNPGLHPQMQPFSNKGIGVGGALDCGVPPERPASTSVFPPRCIEVWGCAQSHLVGSHGARQPLPGSHHRLAGRRVQACRLWRSPGPHRVRHVAWAQQRATQHPHLPGAPALCW